MGRDGTWGFLAVTGLDGSLPHGLDEVGSCFSSRLMLTAVVFLLSELPFVLYFEEEDE